MDLEFKQKIQKLKEKINIVDVVSQYLKLHQKGNNFWVVCPFHEDSNPSLSISQEKQIYKCFSCGQQGDVFMFLQKFKNLDFFSALKQAASIVKIDLKDFNLEMFEQQQNTNLHKFKILNNLALNFYQYQLTTLEGKKALQYLKERNINEKEINDFYLGYAPNNNQLLEYLELQGYNKIDIIESGLAKISNDDKIKDTFFNRIIFPILDLEGNCLGFSARKYNSSSKENFKYINSPENEIFKKGKILYNLYNAKKSLTNTNMANIYLVEGFMDVISLSKEKITNCVALMGTNLTKEQINILNKITKNIIVFLDGDQAGKLAAIKISNNLMLNNFNVKIIDNSTNLDPDELVLNSKNFKEIISNILHPLDFASNFFLQKYDIKKNSEELKIFLTQLKPLYQSIKDPITTKFYINNLQKITNLTQQELLIFFELKTKSSYPTSKFINPNIKKINKLSLQTKILEVQKQLFFLLLLSRKVYLFLEKEKFIFYNKHLLNLYFLISQQYQENENLSSIDFKKTLFLLKENELFDFLQSIINQYQDKSYEINNHILKDYLKIIKKYLIEIDIENLRHKINEESSTTTKIELLQKISILKNKLNE